MQKNLSQKRLQQEHDKFQKDKSVNSIPTTKVQTDYALSLRHCPDAEVSKNKQKYLNVKSKFGNKLKHLRISGTQLQTSRKFEIWLDANIDTLYNDWKLKDRFMDCNDDKFRKNNIESMLTTSQRLSKDDYFKYNVFKNNIMKWFLQK